MYYFSLIVFFAVIVQFALLPAYIRLKRAKDHRFAMLAVKASMTLIAFAFCLGGVIKVYSVSGSVSELVMDNGLSTSIFLPAGMLVCVIADVVLQIHPIFGTALFLIGHLCYIAHYLTIAPFNPVCIIFMAAGFLVLVRVYGGYKEMAGKYLAGCILYSVVVLFSASLGLALPLSIGVYGFVPAISAVMLCISDSMLAYNLLPNKKRVSDLLYLGYYFMGQFFLALSVFVPAFMLD